MFQILGAFSAEVTISLAALNSPGLLESFVLMPVLEDDLWTIHRSQCLLSESGSFYFKLKELSSQITVQA